MDCEFHVACTVSYDGFVLQRHVVQELQAIMHVFSVSAACLDAWALGGVSMVESTALARNKNTPVTS